MAHKFELGSVSSATMRPEDLIPTFLDELTAIGDEEDKQLINAINQRMEQEDYYTQEDCHYDLDDLFDALNNHAPPYCYFGAHPGDGSDYGFWISEDMESDFEGCKVEDSGDVPIGYNGEVLQINDHGNMTLWMKDKDKFTEVWSTV